MQIYNSLTRSKEPFVPATPKKVNIYACGITAYDYCHVGHARSAIVFDVLVRYLRSKGYIVTFARNFTDVDDKIIARAAQKNLSCNEIAEKYIQAFHEDMDTLNVLRPDVEPRATEHIADMIHFCEVLIQKEHAYATASGDVYFRVRSFPEYGKLSGRSIDELQSGARIIPGEEKEDPLDFALWKAAKPDEPFWESPWGKGRPGWHIECSAMSEKHLPLPLDIHGGGQDLIFPHHENEIAQSEAATGKQFCRYWMHNGFVQIDSQKMSKSLGNFKTIRDILEHYHPEVLRLFLLSRHYHNPIDFTEDAMEDAEKNVKRLYETIAAVADALHEKSLKDTPIPADIATDFDRYCNNFLEAMEEDLNTAAALGHIFSISRLMNRVLDDTAMRKSKDAHFLFEHFQKNMRLWSDILGVLDKPAPELLHALRSIGAKRKGIVSSEIEALMADRAAARAAKDFAKADALRDTLQEKGVVVRDTPAGPIWDLG